MKSLHLAQSVGDQLIKKILKGSSFLADLALLRQIKKDLRESSRVGEDAAGKTKLALLREKFKNAKKQKDQMTNEKEAASLR